MRCLTELGFTLQQAKEYCQRNQCLVCNGPVVIAFNKEYVLRCGDPAHGPEQWGRPSSKPNMYQEANQIKRSAKEMAEQTENPTALSTIVHSGLLTQKRAAEIVRTFWPKAPDAEVTKAAILCESYGLNPLMKHVFLIPFKDQWALVMGISATRLIAQRQGDFSYLDDTPRVMTADEQVKAFGEVDQQKIWAVCKLKNVKTGATSIGRGNWPKGTPPQGTDKGNTAANMAFIRAERQALDRLCPGKMPANVEVMDESLVDLPDTVKQVNTATGEIVEGTAQQLPAASPAPAAPPPPTTGALSDDLGACPIHEVPNIRLRSKSNPKWHGVGHYIDKEQGGGICYKDKQTVPVVEKPAEADFTEQPTDDSSGAEEPAPAASPQENDEATGDRVAINNLAQQLYGPDWQPKLRNHLKDAWGLQSRNAIKEAQIPEIIKKLTDMVNAMK